MRRLLWLCLGGWGQAEGCWRGARTVLLLPPHPFTTPPPPHPRTPLPWRKWPGGPDSAGGGCDVFSTRLLSPWPRATAPPCPPAPGARLQESRAGPSRARGLAQGPATHQQGSLLAPRPALLGRGEGSRACKADGTVGSPTHTQVAVGAQAGKLTRTTFSVLTPSVGTSPPCSANRDGAQGLRRVLQHPCSPSSPKVLPYTCPEPSTAPSPSLGVE